jgi:hypothetical protein
MKLRLWFILSTVAIAVIAAMDHTSAQTSALRDLIPRPSAAEAVADTYGQIIAGELARRLSELSDSTCQKSRNINPAILRSCVGEMLVSYGTKLVALQSSRVSEDALAAKLDELAGVGSAAELRAFADEHRIKQLQEFFRAKHNDILVDQITTALDHYSIIRRLFRGAINPLSSSNFELAIMAAQRAVDAENAAKETFGRDPRLQRLVDLYGSFIDAYEMELIRSNSLTSPDYEVFQGVEEPLQALCVRVAS